MGDYYAITRSDYLSHHGILGQKWGVRRFQLSDGTRTALGKARRRVDEGLSKAGKFARSAVGESGRAAKKVATVAGAAAKTKATASMERLRDRRDAARRDRQAAKEQKKLDRIAAKEQKKVEKRQKELLKARKDPNLLAKHLDEFSLDELKAIQTRLDWERKVGDLQRGKLEDMQKWVKAGVGFVDTLAGVYDAAETLSSIIGKTREGGKNFAKDDKKIASEKSARLTELERHLKEPDAAKWIKDHAIDYTADEIKAVSDKMTNVNKLVKNSTNETSKPNSGKGNTPPDAPSGSVSDSLIDKDVQRAAAKGRKIISKKVAYMRTKTSQLVDDGKEKNKKRQMKVHAVELGNATAQGKSVVDDMVRDSYAWEVYGDRLTSKFLK